MTKCVSNYEDFLGAAEAAVNVCEAKTMHRNKCGETSKISWYRLSLVFGIESLHRLFLQWIRDKADSRKSLFLSARAVRSMGALCVVWAEAPVGPDLHSCVVALQYAS